MIRQWACVLAALAFALALPPLAAAEGSLEITGGCGDRLLSVTIPFDRPALPQDDGGCCDSAACHLSSDRQKRNQRRG